LGDALWEVFVREIVVSHAQSQKQMHDLTVANVRAEFQAQILDGLEDFLCEEEKELIRRARNLPTTVNKRHNQKIHRAATAFEALLGHFYLEKRERLEQLYERLKDCILLK
jgi:ribonuclease-3 family protein